MPVTAVSFSLVHATFHRCSIVTWWWGEKKKKNSLQHWSAKDDKNLNMSMEDQEDENKVTHKQNKSSSESFLFQLVQNGLDSLYSLLSGLPDTLLSLSLHRV